MSARADGRTLRSVSLRLAMAVIALMAASVSGSLAAPNSSEPQLLAGSTRSLAQATPLTKQSLTGRAYVFVWSAAGARSARLYIDRRPGGHARAIASLRARGGKLAPAVLDTLRLHNGRHTLWASIALSHKKVAVVSARFSVANTARDLIAAALASHQISYGEALLYRFYSIWGDRRLPKRYHAKQPGVEEGLLADASYAVAHNKVRGRAAAALEPFLARPADPRSVFSGRSGGRHRGPRESAVSAAAPGSTATACGKWTSVGDGRVRVWVKDSDAAATQLEQSELATAEAALAAEKPDMDLSPPDDSGGAFTGCYNPDGALDIYLVTGGDYVEARGGAPLSVEASGFTSPWRSTQGGGCSSFVLIDGARNAAEREVATYHELFHVLENAHACEKTPLDSWLTEAGATWAGANYSPTFGRVALSQALENYESYQQSWRSLSDYGGDPESFESYENFVWVLFMYQEGVHPAAVWDAIKSASSQDDVLHKLDGMFSFADHFRDFAVRDLNMPYDGRSFQEGAGAMALPSIEPTGRQEPTVTLEDTGGQDRQEDLVKPNNLDFRYQTINIPNKIRYVKLDFSQLGSDVDVDALEKVAGSSELQREKLSGKQLEFCRDDPGKDISQIIAVYSNHSLAQAGPDTGLQMTYKTDPQCTGDHLTGTLKLTVTGTSPQPGPDCPFNTFTANFVGSANVDLYGGGSADTTPEDNSEADLQGSYNGQVDACGPKDSFDATFPKQVAQAPGNPPVLATWWLDGPENDPLDPSPTPHVDVQVTFSTAGVRHDTASGLGGGDACSYNDGQTSTNESVSWLSNTYSVNVPPAGQSTTITVTDNNPAFTGDGDCFEQYADPQITGTLTVHAGSKSG